MPNYACKLVDSSGAMTERSITAKSMQELYQIMDRSGERLISAKKTSLQPESRYGHQSTIGEKSKSQKTAT